MIQSELIIGLIGVVMTGLSSYISWILAKRKYDSEVDHNVIGNMKEVLEFYEDFSNSSKERLAEVLEDNKKLRNDIDELIDENQVLRRDIGELKDQVIKLSTSICYDLSCKIRQKEVLNSDNSEKDSTE